MALELDHLSDEEILRKRKSLKRELSSQPLKRLSRKIAILGGSTTTAIKEVLELYLLAQSIEPQFYESSYNQYFEDAVFGNPDLDKFHPDIIFVHTSSVNISRFPTISESPEQIQNGLQQEFQKFQNIWTNLRKKFPSAVIIQNNFELLPYRDLGSLDNVDPRGRNSFLSELNRRFSNFAIQSNDIVINDLNYLASYVGLAAWHDPHYWYSYKYSLSQKAIPILAKTLARIIGALSGKAKKCLILDLDNTLWGGVIGDDGLQGIALGKDSALGEAHADFQAYAQRLSHRGIVLAVASKNDHGIAKSGFEHPDSVLRFDDFGAFKANWDPKNINIQNIAFELSLGLDSMVFIDDNPAEREIIKKEVSQVCVPDVGSDVANYLRILDRGNYFEPIRISADDLGRKAFYAGNLKRNDFQSNYTDYTEFLRSLEMKAEIAHFSPLYMDRITQLINKTNQFNLTTRRYTRPEIDSILSDPNYLTFYAKLSDKFGDNGLVSAVIGRICDETLHIDLWVMSCRVLKRDLEKAVFDAIVSETKRAGLSLIQGLYIPTERNGLVAEHYKELGFTRTNPDNSGNDHITWQFHILNDYKPTLNNVIEVVFDQN